MRKSYFIDLAKDTKTELTWNYGELVTTLETDDYYITLFLLDNFFVEIFIDKFNKELVDINIQDDDDILFAYLKDLSLGELISKC
ncbi:MAG: hypothetical protein H0W73_08375 [Bacteroidetes bacterium]|nr:hypothetical protein [Bacteroidota bacterium]